MQRNVRRLTLATLCAMACGCLAAAVALAATTVATKPATKVTTSTAVLNGVIHTGGAAVNWQFQFTKTSKFSTGRATPIQTIPKGKGTVTVSRTVVKLSANTLYSFRIVAITGKGTRINGNVRTFRTKNTGKFLLDSTKLSVTSAGVVSPPFTCASTSACITKYRITTLAKLATGPIARVVCVNSSFFTIAAHKRAKESAKVSTACKTLMQKAAHHKITGTLTADPRTLQQSVDKNVTLTLA